jgi:carbon monoxide dehydrogenase subunit G
VRIEHEIHIERDPAEVFAFLSDPEKRAAWQPTTIAVRRHRQGPLTVGERFDEVHKAFGRELTSTVEVVAYDAPRLFALHIASGAVPLDGRWELEPSDGGTRLRFVSEADVRGPMRLAKPVLARQFRRYHERLKDLLEQGTTSR